MLDHVAAQVVAHQIGVPAHPGGEVLLHPVRRAVARDLGQLPAVLALDRGEQSSPSRYARARRYARVRRYVRTRRYARARRRGSTRPNRDPIRATSPSRPRAQPSASATPVMPSPSSARSIAPEPRL